MRFGLAVMNDFPPGTVPMHRLPLMREQVRAAASAGLDSAWVLQHYLGNMPTLQPIPTLAALAADAGDMFLGTNMYILPLHHPVQVAEDFATLDHISGGRAIAGFGMGYRENEFQAFGIGLDERVGRYEEAMAVIRGLWTGEPVTFDGRYYRIDGEHLSLPPVQPGGPAVWIGAGAHRTGARRAAALGDAWIIPPHVSLPRLQTILEVERAERARLGRPASGEVVIRRELVLDPDAEVARQRGLAARGALTGQYAAYNAPDKTESYRHLGSAEAANDVADESYLFTDPETCVLRLKELEAAGVTTVVLRMQWFDLPQQDMLSTLELFADQVLPHFR